MQVSIYRYNPDVDEVPQMRDMNIDLPEGKDLMVLDVLELLKAQDSSLTYRRSCREGVCGSDGINMNGKNGLACITPVSEVAKGGKLILRPLDYVEDSRQQYGDGGETGGREQVGQPLPMASGKSAMGVSGMVDSQSDR